jgi:hypothetical protein
MMRINRLFIVVSFSDYASGRPIQTSLTPARWCRRCAAFVLIFDFFKRERNFFHRAAAVSIYRPDG